MMDGKTFVITTDSACDLPDEMLEKIDVKCENLKYTIDGVEYEDGAHTLSVPDFYDKVRAGSMPTTAQMNMARAKEIFSAYLSQGMDVLHLSFSSALSGSYNSAVMAAEELREEYPQQKIMVVDTKSASMGQGLFVYLCAMERLKNKSIQEVFDYAEKIKLHVCHYFTVEDLHHLHRGGRVSKVSAVVGTALGIKPVLHVNDLGQLIPLEKVRGRKTSLDALVKHMKGNAWETDEPVIFISHGDCLADAQYVGEKVKELYPNVQLTTHYIGPVIGAHSGPGTVALFFLGEKR